MAKNIKILIVEDSATQAVKLEYILEKNNYKVLIAENGVEALDIIKAKQPDLVITDIIMPEMDGFELCQKIRENNKFAELPIIMLTQLSKPGDITKGLKCGANDFIIKPYNGKALITHVKNIISIRHYQKYIKENINILIENPTRRKTMGSRSSDILEQNKIEHTIEKTLHVYEKLWE